jgi:hypothetical protein
VDGATYVHDHKGGYIATVRDTALGAIIVAAVNAQPPAAGAGTASPPPPEGPRREPGDGIREELQSQLAEATVRAEKAEAERDEIAARNFDHEASAAMTTAIAERWRADRDRLASLESELSAARGRVAAYEAVVGAAREWRALIPSVSFEYLHPVAKQLRAAVDALPAEGDGPNEQKPPATRADGK